MTPHFVIIDDDPIFRLITVRTLAQLDGLNLKLHEFENGKDAVIALKNFDTAGENIIILLDINMPVMNGWEFLKQINNLNHPIINNMTIYIVTSSTDESDIIKAENFSIVNGFFPKPLEMVTLRTLVCDI